SGKRAMLVSISNQDGNNKSFPTQPVDLYSYQRLQTHLETPMNSRPLHPSLLLTERVVSGLGRALHAAGILRALWCGYRGRRRDARAVDAIADMNAHMLRDIGTHDRLIAHAAARSDAEHRQRIAFQLSTPLLVVALIATATPGTVAQAADSPPTSRAPAKAQLI